jgi:WD40 repeat protein
MLAFFSPIDGTVRIWDHWRKNELRKFKVSIGANQIPTMAFSPDSKRIALANKILDTDTGQELFQLNGHSLNINNLNFSPDGKWIVSSSEDGTFTVWSAETGNKQYQFANSKISFRKATFLPDGEHIAAISSQKNIWIWNVKNFSLFLLNSNPMPRYKVFIEAVKFLWQLDVQGLEIVHKKRTQADMERFGSLLAPPPLGKSKFDQVLEWAEKQQ